MNHNLLLELPLKNPVVIFAIVLFVILLSPIILKKFKIPGLVGLIISGMLLGPNGFNILARDSSIILFGTVGLLYIMFIAGLELDMNDFKKYRKKSLVFGVLTFLIPLTLGMIVCHYILGLDILPSLLVASMFSTHTLVSYPIVSRLGLVKNESVGITVGGTIFTDTAVLLLFAVITGAYSGELTTGFWIRLLLFFSIFVFIVLYLFPIITKWFFKNIEPESVWQYIFILALLFTAGFLAEVAGVEPIIGAFIAGLALNRLIPHNSALMDKIDFVGNAIFIPFFLISVGMIVDLKVLAKGPEAVTFAVILTITAIITKWLAAHFTGKIFHYSRNQISLIFGLSASHAAATLALILVGYNIGLIDENVLNGTIVLILVTCLASSFVTESAGRKIALAESRKEPVIINKAQRILVPVSNPENITKLVEFGINIKESSSEEMIFALMVFDNDSEIKEKMLECRKTLDNSAKFVSPKLINRIQLTSRIDVNPLSGIMRAVKELLITDVVIGISEKNSFSDFIFGNFAENLVNDVSENIYIIRSVNPLNTVDKIFVFIPENSELEVGFEHIIVTIAKLATNIGGMAVFCGFGNSLTAIRYILKKYKLSLTASFELAADIDEYSNFISWIQPDDMIVMLHARSKSISFSLTYEYLINTISDSFPKNNFALVYIEQNPVVQTESYTKYDILDGSAVSESLQIVDKIKLVFGRKRKKLPLKAEKK